MAHRRQRTGGARVLRWPVPQSHVQGLRLRVDAMTREDSNGGIYILTEFQEKGFPRKGFEVQVNNSYKADRVKTGSLYHVLDTGAPLAERR